MTDLSTDPATAMPRSWHADSAEETAATLGSSPGGLSEQEAARRPVAGVEPAKRDGFWEELGESLTEPLQLLLIAVGVLSAVFGELSDAIAIFVVIVMVALTETISEWRAGRAIDALHALSAPTARVLRDGTPVEVPAAALVTGDVVLLEAGDVVPADARVVTGWGLRTDESTLTGEAEPVGKSAVAVAGGAHLAERSSMVYAGTAVVAGAGRALVTAVGADTELGQLGHLISQEREPATPLQKSLSELARSILWVALAASVLVPLVGIAAGQSWRDMLLAGLVLAFATVPEELPLLVTALLAVGGRRLAKRGALLRRLRAAETLGAVTVVVTDKTGTLTENHLQLTYVHGERRLILATALAAGADANEGGAEPLEAELRQAATAEDLPRPRQTQAVFAFDPQRKLVSRVRPDDDGNLKLAVSGAPEAVLSRCAMASAERASAEAWLEEFTSQGLRVIAFARRALNHIPDEHGSAERELELVGFAAFADPLRDGVSEAVAELTGAGVATLVVTGDHPDTARAVARQAGLGEDIGGVLGGSRDLEHLSDPELCARLVHGTVIARATPADKLRVVRQLQARGEVVAVTGDGVNDAPALAAADAGIAMGRRGSDLARRAADVVLTDDVYPTVAAAIAAGRALSSQLRRAVTFYLGAKLALVSVMLAALALGHPAPFSPAAIVVLELFMDLGASVAFICEPQAPDAMRRPPRPAGARFLGRPELTTIATVGVALTLAALGAYLLAGHLAGTGAARTAALLAWLAGHALIAWSLRARPGLPWRANPAFPLWAATATLAGLLLALAPLGAPFRLAGLTAETAVTTGIAVALGVAAAWTARHAFHLTSRL
jgi:Ca2+-transporting ATPase